MPEINNILRQYYTNINSNMNNFQLQPFQPGSKEKKLRMNDHNRLSLQFTVEDSSGNHGTKHVIKTSYVEG